MSELEDNFLVIATSSVWPDLSQPRKSFDSESMATLVASIKQYGQLQPITVREAAEGYVIVAGERRYRAIVELGLPTLTAKVIEASDRLAYELAVMENTVRDDLNPMEEAVAYHRLYSELGMTMVEVAATAGTSQQHVSDVLKLIQLEPKHQDAYRAGLLPMKAVHLILQVDAGPVRDKLVDQLKQGMGLREARTWVASTGFAQQKALNKKTAPKVGAGAYDQFYELVEADVKERLEWNVKLVTKGRRGAITIPFNSLAELHTIWGRISK